MSTAPTSNVRDAEKRPFRRFFADLGPGLITGAADDDPSGMRISTASGRLRVTRRPRRRPLRHRSAPNAPDRPPSGLGSLADSRFCRSGPESRRSTARGPSRRWDRIPNPGYAARSESPPTASAPRSRLERSPSLSSSIIRVSRRPITGRRAVAPTRSIGVFRPDREVIDHPVNAFGVLRDVRRSRAARTADDPALQRDDVLRGVDADVAALQQVFADEALVNAGGDPGVGHDLTGLAEALLRLVANDLRVLDHRVFRLLDGLTGGDGDRSQRQQCERNDDPTEVLHRCVLPS